MPALVGTLSFAKALQTAEDKIPGVRCLLITPKRKDRGRSLLFTSGECNKHQQLTTRNFCFGGTKTEKSLTLSS